MRRAQPLPRPGFRWRVRLRALCDGEFERGATTLEVVIIFPLLLLVITALIQGALWFHARSLALAAAEEGVVAARAYQARPDAGPTRAREFLNAHAGDVLASITVGARPAGRERVRVEVAGRTLSILPGIPGPLVSQAAEGPIERFTLAGEP
ncbi:TadE family protein [Pengzhenrongella sicca]|nr:TadE family protein [Pengzhenrongella sicca]